MRPLIVLGSILLAAALLGISLWVLGEDEAVSADSTSEVVDVPGQTALAQPVQATPLDPEEEVSPVIDVDGYRGDGVLYGQLLGIDGQPVVKGEVWVYGAIDPQLSQLLENREAHSEQVLELYAQLFQQQAQVEGSPWQPRRVRRVTTDEDGRFRINDLAAGKFSVDAHDGTYSLVAPVPVELVESGPRVEVDLALSLGSTVTVYVRDTFGQPLANAKVSAQTIPGAMKSLGKSATHPGIRDPITQRRARTNERGEARLVGLRTGGTVQVEASLKGYYLAENVPPISLSGDASVTVQLGAYSVLAGVVIGIDGQPAAKANVAVEGQSDVSCDDEGRFRLEDVQVGEGPLTLRAATPDLDGIARETLTLVKGQKREDLRILLQKSARIHGRVSDRRGMPIAGATVWANRQADRSQIANMHRAMTEDLLALGNGLPVAAPSEIGSYLDAGEYMEIVDEAIEEDEIFSSYEMVSEDVETAFTSTEVVAISNDQWVFSSSTGSSAIQLAPSIQIDFGDRLSRLTMNVDSNSWLSVAPSAALMSGEGRAVTTDENGEYEILGLWPGTFNVNASAEEYLPADETVTVELPVLGAEGQASFELTRGARLEGVTYGPDGLPAKNIDIFVLNKGEYTATVSSDEEGRYVATGLPEATYDIFARSGDYSVLAQINGRLLQVEQDYLGVDLHLLPGGKIVGFVTDMAGRPIPNAQVNVTTMIDGQVSRDAHADESGAYVIENLYDGEYRLSATSGSHLPGQVENIFVRRGDVLPQDVRLSRGGVVAGRVIDEMGTPAPKVNVFLHHGIDRQVVETDAQGEYRFEKIAAGPCRVFVRSDDYRRNAYREVTLTAEEERLHFDIQLHPAGRAIGRVLGKGGVGPGGLTVQARSLPDGHVTRKGTTSDDGRFEIENLYEGRYRLFVEGQEESAVTFTVGPSGVASDLTVTYQD